MFMWKPTGHLQRLAAPGQSKSPLLLSTKFSAQSELNDFFGFFRLVIADENEHDPFFFCEGIWTNFAACTAW